MTRSGRNTPFLSICQRATTYITAALDEIASLADLTTEGIGARLVAKLVPFVNEANYIACHVAMVRNEKAEVGFMMVGMRAQWPPNLVAPSKEPHAKAQNLTQRRKEGTEKQQAEAPP
jgi:hypothetical protein